MLQCVNVNITKQKIANQGNGERQVETELGQASAKIEVELKLKLEPFLAIITTDKKKTITDKNNNRQK